MYVIVLELVHEPGRKKVFTAPSREEAERALKSQGFKPYSRVPTRYHGTHRGEEWRANLYAPEEVNQLVSFLEKKHT